MSGWRDDLIEKMQRGRVRGAFRSREARRMAKLRNVRDGFSATLVRYGELGPPHRACQFPLWPDGSLPTHEFCGAPTHFGTSWCAHHLACITAPVDEEQDPDAELCGELFGYEELIGKSDDEIR